LKPADFSGELGLFLRYGSHGLLEVPDPYYGGAAGCRPAMTTLVLGMFPRSRDSVIS
jgi:hypothetical protein